jgi:hypothetical protein
MIYPTPTVAAIRGVAVPSEDAKTAALTLLFSAYPRNTNIGEVLAKTATLNSLYSTNIFGLVAAAEHIIAAQIDPLLADESPKAVKSLERMTFGTKSRRTYSFATKYCSWHKPDVYPIYDQFVGKALLGYAAESRFASFTNAELVHYESFLRIMKAFVARYDLQACSLREVDYFLWFYGRAAGG